MSVTKQYGKLAGAGICYALHRQTNITAIYSGRKERRAEYADEYSDIYIYLYKNTYV